MKTSVFIRKLKYKFIRAKVFVEPFFYFLINKLNLRLSDKLRNTLGITQNIAIFDLRVSPITFDFVYFLAGASYYFSSNGKKFTLLIVSDNAQNADAPWEGYNQVITREKLKVRIYNLLLPLAFCFSQCQNSIKIIHSSDLPILLRKGDNIYPSGYKAFKPKSINYSEIFAFIHGTNYSPQISSPSYYVEKVKDFLETNKVFQTKPSDFLVTLTLRSYQFQMARNTLPSDIEFICSFCEQRNIKIVVIPDTDSPPSEQQADALKRFNNLIMWESPSYSIFLRLALYEFADLNFFSNNGPVSLAVMGAKTKGIILNFGDESNPGNGGKNYFKKYYNIEPGSQPFERFSCFVQWEKSNNEELMQHINKLSN